MKKSKKKPARKKLKAASAPVEPTRRDALKWMRTGAVAVVGLGVVGYFGTRSVQATIREHDLDRIGNGVPTIVQIHDPSCALCRQLQRETRAALKRFDSGALQYLVANINTDEGRALAGRNGVGHVTLLLMNGAGETQEIISGTQDRDVLEAAFEAHLAR